MSTRRRIASAILALSSLSLTTSVAAQQRAPARCTARPAASFHLRPRPVEQSIGPTIAARTELLLLDERRYAVRLLSTLRKVRVVATGAVGYTFLSAAEYSASCAEPVLSPPAEPETDPFEAEIVRRGTFATPEAALVTGWSATRGAQLDVDNDGELDQLLSATNDGRGAALVALRRARGWEVQVLDGPSQEPCAFEPAFGRGADTWLRLRCISQGESMISESVWLLFRFDPRRAVARLAGTVTGDRLSGDNVDPHPHRWRFEAPSPGVLQVTGDRGAPLVRRFNAAQWRWE